MKNCSSLFRPRLQFGGLASLLCAALFVFAVGCTDTPTEGQNDGSETNAENNDDPSNESTNSGVLAAPEDFAADAGDGVVDLSWSAASEATGYNLYRCDAETFCEEVVASPTETSYQDTDVENGTTYYYWVSSTRTEPTQETDPNGPISATPQAESTLAGPSDLNCEQSEGQLQFDWTAPDGDEHTGYRLYGSQTDPETQDADDLLVEFTDSSATTGTYTPDPPVDAPAQYGLRSVRSEPPEEIESIATTTGCEPSDASGLTATPEDSVVYLGWQADAWPGVLGVDNYTVHWGTDGPAESKQVTCAPGTLCQSGITGLTNGTEYTFWVVANNPVGSSGEPPEGGISTTATPQASTSAQGQLDTSFGTDGVVTTTVGGGDARAIDSVLHQDGGWIVVGYTNVESSQNSKEIAAIARYDEGGLDTSFGENGVQTTELGGPGPQNEGTKFRGVDVQSNGKIVAAGWGWTDDTGGFGIARYNPDGTLDDTFGDGGVKVVQVHEEYNDWAWDVTVQFDDSILIGGASTIENDNHFTLVQLTPEGEVDTSFGNAGSSTLQIGLGASTIRSMAVDRSKGGGIVVAGRCQPEGTDNLNNSSFCGARFTHEGELDESFGDEGVFIEDIAEYDSTTTVANSEWVLPLGDGRTIVGGWGYVDGGSSKVPIVARYTVGGEIDPSFGDGGVVIHNIGFDIRANSGALEESGNIVLGIQTGGVTGGDGGIMRLTEDGDLDESFNDTGYVLDDLAGDGNTAQLHGVSINPAGQILLAGRSRTSLSDEEPWKFLVARYD